MKHDRHAAISTLLVMVWASSCWFFFRFDAPGMFVWLILGFGSSLWMSLRSPGFKRAGQAWRDAYRNRSSSNSPDPEAQA